MSSLPPPVPKQFTPPPIPGRYEQIIARLKEWTGKLFKVLHLDSFNPVLSWLAVLSLLLGPIFVISVLANAVSSSPTVQSTQPAALLIASTTAIPTQPDTPTTVLPPTDTPSPTIAFTSTITYTPTIAFTPTFTLTPTVTLPAIDPAGCVNPNAERQVATVTKIVDGDTIHVEINGEEFKLRYIGMDAPEVGAYEAAAATAYNSELVMGQTVTLVKDVSETDRYGRLLRYVFVGDKFVNYELVRHGLATAGTWAPDTACDSTFQSAQQTAMANGVGLWVPTATAKPYVAPVTTPSSEAFGFVGGGSAGTEPTAVSGGSCPQGCTVPPSGCVIKGNINSEGEKIYHLPGMAYYNKTVIDPSKGERWFCTEQEAVANGWRKSKK